MQHTQNFVRSTGNTRSAYTSGHGTATLKYTVIKTDSQYYRYCDALETLIETGKKTKAIRDEIELLQLLIEKYDTEKNSFFDADPIELLKTLMQEHKMKAVHLAKLLNVSEGLVSDMLHYRKGLSKETIRILSSTFKVRQEAFNRINARLKEV